MSTRENIRLIARAPLIYTTKITKSKRSNLTVLITFCFHSFPDCPLQRGKVDSVADPEGVGSLAQTPSQPPVFRYPMKMT